MTVPVTAADINTLINNMAEDVRQQLDDKQPLLIGIHTGGVWVAQQIASRLSSDFFVAPLGMLNITYYRDDFTHIGMHPQVLPSDLPFDIDNRHLLLVDDILHSGRTVRAALNEIFDYGRPASVTLAVLIERDGHQLPFKADIIGKSIRVDTKHYIKLTKENGGILKLNVNTRENIT